MIRFFTGILVDYFHCSADFLLGLSDEPHYEENYLPTPPFKDSFRAALGENKTTQYSYYILASKAFFCNRFCMLLKSFVVH